MTGQDFQDKLDAIVVDLQTNGKGMTVNVAMRAPDNAVLNFPLSSTTEGVVNAVQLQNIQDFITNLKTFADAYETNRAPVDAALEAFRTAQAPHETLIALAAAARKNLSDALEADAAYQTAKATLDAARIDAAYVSAANDYRSANISENYGNLGDAKGKYAA